MLTDFLLTEQEARNLFISRLHNPYFLHELDLGGDVGYREHAKDLEPLDLALFGTITPNGVKPGLRSRPPRSS